MSALNAFAYCGLWRNERRSRQQWLMIQRQEGIVKEQRIELSQQEVELDENCTLTKGMQCVLGGLCDLVFELGEDGVVLGSDMARDNLFGCAMQGLVLTEKFVEDGSAERFRDLLQRAIDTLLLQTMNATFFRQSSGEKACFEAEILVVNLQGKQHSRRPCGKFLL